MYLSITHALYSIWLWDNKVFGINKMEAENMDPQHKLALEVSFRALEDGGITMQSLKGTNTAVYMGKYFFAFVLHRYYTETIYIFHKRNFNLCRNT